MEHSLKAIEKYNCLRHSRLSTYASFWQPNSIVKSLKRNNGAIRLPKRIYEIGKAVKDCTAELSFRLGRSPSVVEIASHTGLTQKNVEDAKEYERLQDVRSLDETLDDTEDSLVLGEIVPCQESAQPENLAEVKWLREFAASILNSLNERERFVIESKYGLAHREEMTFEEIGKNSGDQQATRSANRKWRHTQI